jgi:hypothetical protein
MNCQYCNQPISEDEMQQCQGCGLLLIPPYLWLIGNRYCSQECKQRARWRRKWRKRNDEKNVQKLRTGTK